MKLIGIFLLVTLTTLTGCVTTEYLVAERNVSVVSGIAGSDRPDYQRIESIIAGVTNMFTSHGWKSYPTSLSYHVTGGRIYHVNFAFDANNLGCSMDMDRYSTAFRFYEVESSPHSGYFSATPEHLAQVRALATQVETYLRAELPSSYELHVSNR